MLQEKGHLKKNVLFLIKIFDHQCNKLLSKVNFCLFKRYCQVLLLVLLETRYKGLFTVIRCIHNLFHGRGKDFLRWFDNKPNY